ncbi:hypothetical protein EDB83DRAFT_2323917 [Lactarius deliciosus]|nr:hypothetical protein EDB83DRAFT_2323917 [Lactarius deliciosus]
MHLARHRQTGQRARLIRDESVQLNLPRGSPSFLGLPLGGGHSSLSFSSLGLCSGRPESRTVGARGRTKIRIPNLEVIHPDGPFVRLLPVPDPTEISRKTSTRVRLPRHAIKKLGGIGFGDGNVRVDDVVAEKMVLGTEWETRMWDSSYADERPCETPPMTKQQWRGREKGQGVQKCRKLEGKARMQQQGHGVPVIAKQHLCL